MSGLSPKSLWHAVVVSTPPSLTRAVDLLEHSEALEQEGGLQTSAPCDYSALIQHGHQPSPTGVISKYDLFIKALPSARVSFSRS